MTNIIVGPDTSSILVNYDLFNVYCDLLFGDMHSTNYNSYVINCTCRNS